MGYTGVPKPQMSMDEVPEKFAPSPSSVQEGIASSSSRTATTSKFVSRPPAYYPHSEDVSGSFVLGNANCIWQVAPYLSEPQFKDRQRVPLSKADHAQLRKLSIVAHLLRALRAFDVKIGEQAWEKPVYARMALAPDNYLRPMQNNLADPFLERYTLRGGETWEFHSVYAHTLQSLEPIPKNLVPRTRCCVMVDSTIPCDLLYDNIMPDVMVVTMPLSRLAVAMFAPEIEGSLKEPPPRILFPRT